MARQFVVVALVLFAVVGFSCAVPTTPAAEAPKAGAAADLAPGAAKADGAAAPGAAADAAAESPAGGSAAAGSGSVPAEAPKSGASTVELSAVTAVAAGAGIFLF